MAATIEFANFEKYNPSFSQVLVKMGQKGLMAGGGPSPQCKTMALGHHYLAAEIFLPSRADDKIFLGGRLQDQRSGGLVQGNGVFSEHGEQCKTNIC